MTYTNVRVSEFQKETNVIFRIPQFNGIRIEDYVLCRMRLGSSCRFTGVWDVAEKPHSDLASSSSATPSSTTLRTTEKREKASAIIIHALGDDALRVVIEVDNNPARMPGMPSAEPFLASQFKPSYSLRSKIVSKCPITLLSTCHCFRSLSIWEGMPPFQRPTEHRWFLATTSLNCFLKSTAAALRTKETNELTGETVATLLIDEYITRHASEIPTGGCSGPAVSNGPKHCKKKNKPFGEFKKVISKGLDDGGLDDECDLDRTINAFAAALQSSKSGNFGTKSKCDLLRLSVT